MNTAVFQLMAAATGQIETAERVTTMLKDGGAWGLLTLSLLAIAWLAKQYINARDEKDKAVQGLNVELTSLLKQVISSSAEQKASNDKVCDALERMERKQEHVG